MNPPANPNAAQARADWQAYAQQAGWISAPPETKAPEPRPPLKLYPLAVVVPVWVHTCNEAGVTIWIDDPASM